MELAIEIGMTILRLGILIVLVSLFALFLVGITGKGRKR